MLPFEIQRWNVHLTGKLWTRTYWSSVELQVSQGVKSCTSWKSFIDIAWRSKDPVTAYNLIEIIFLSSKCFFLHLPNEFIQALINFLIGQRTISFQSWTTKLGIILKISLNLLLMKFFLPENSITATLKRRNSKNLILMETLCEINLNRLIRGCWNIWLFRTKSVNELITTAILISAWKTGLFN